MHSKQTYGAKISGTPSNVMCYGQNNFCVNENVMGKQKKVKHLKKYYLEKKIHTFQLIISDKFIVNIVLTKGWMHIHSKESIKLFYKRIVNIYLVLFIFFIYIF
jgi:folate-dependent phosphoribosylglycinamide formyltransferase PurN